MRIENRWHRHVNDEQLQRYLALVGIGALRLTKEDGLPWITVEVGVGEQPRDKLMTPRMVLDAASVLQQVLGAPVRFVRMEPQAAEFVLVDASIFDVSLHVFEEYGEDLEKVAQAWGLPLSR